MALDPTILRDIIMDHYEYPRNKELTEKDGYMSRHMASDSCIDDITVQSKIENGIIEMYVRWSCLHDFDCIHFYHDGTCQR